MTCLQAITAEIEPYSLSDESIEKSFVDAADHFGLDASAESDYTGAYKQVCALAAMYALNRVRILAAENIGGISQTYDVKKIDARIAALAKSAGLSADLVNADTEDNITFIQM